MVFLKCDTGHVIPLLKQHASKMWGNTSSVILNVTENKLETFPNFQTPENLLQFVDQSNLNAFIWEMAVHNLPLPHLN